MSKFIYDFVKSMSIREAVYFRRFASLSGNASTKNYIQLFEAFLESDHYDIQKIKEIFKGHPIEKNWSSEVTYLQKQLLKSMANFHLESTTQFKLLKSVLYLNLLIEIGFVKQAYKILIKTKKLAYKYEDFSTILKLIQLEEEILFREGILDFTTNLQALEKERQVISEKIARLNQLRFIRETVRELQFTKTTETLSSRISAYANHELMRSIDKATSVRAKEHWIYAKALLAYLDAEYEVFQNWNLEMIHLLEANTFIFKPSKILVPISNYLFGTALLKDKASFKTMIARLEAKKSNTKLDQVYILYIQHSRSLDFYDRTNNTEAIKQIIIDTKLFLEQYKEQLAVAQSDYLAILLVRACLLTGQYELGITFIHHILNQGYIERSIVHFRLFLMIFYLELGWLELIKSEAISSYKFFTRKKLYTDFSKPLVQFFKRIAKKPIQSKAHYDALISQLDVLYASSEWKSEFEVFDYLKWARDKRLQMDE